MSETKTAVIDRLATTTPERRVGIVEKTWQLADKLTAQHLDEAHALVSQDTTPTHDRMVQLARAAAFESLEKQKKAGADPSVLTAHRAALTLLEIPAATRAQREVDQRPGHLQRDTIKQVSVLSRFNNDFAETMGDMPVPMLSGFPEQLLNRARILGNKLNQPVFTDHEYRTNVDGMRGEVAIMRALQAELPDGYEAQRGSLSDDLHGIDIRIYRGNSAVAIDSKAHHRFDETVQDLYSQNLLNSEELSEAQVDRYALMRTPGNRNTGTQFVVDYTRFGPMNDTGFEFAHPERVAGFFEELLDEIPPQGPNETLHNIGFHAINS